MKIVKLISVLILILALIVVGYFVLKSQSKTNLALNSKFAAIDDKFNETLVNITNFFENCGKKYNRTRRRVIKKVETRFAEESPKTMILHLKHGGVLSGTLIGKTEDTYTVEFKGKKSVVDVSNIKRVEYTTQKDIEWPYKNDVVVKKTNGLISDGEIIAVDKDKVTLLFTEGGGRLEMTVKRSDIECLMFAPVYSKESREIEENLKEQFPDMKVYKEGDVTLLTDSYIRSVQAYRRAIRSVYTEIYLEFFKLFKGRKPLVQNFVVIFDDFNDYAEYAITDGVPFWAVVGYFSPIDDTLYVFNAFGERIEKLVFDVIVGRWGKTIDLKIDELKKKVDKKYHMRIDAETKKFKDRFWKVYSLYKYDLTERTISTLRHEFAHEVFHNWGLQSIIFSKPDIDEKTLIKRKKEFLEAEDCKEKEKLLMSLIRLQEEKHKDIDMEAAQSWLSEGVATYSGTDPIGSIDEAWLFRFQDMTRKNEINPIEFLTVFKMGSFPGLAREGILNAYAQSWAFTNFLMAKHPDGFIEYQIKMADQEPRDDDEELEWLLESLDSDLPTLEKEFRAYMATYKEVEDPYIKRYTKWRNIWADAY